MMIAQKTQHAALRALRAHPSQGRPETADRRAYTADLEPVAIPDTRLRLQLQRAGDDESTARVELLLGRLRATVQRP